MKLLYMLIINIIALCIQLTLGQTWIADSVDQSQNVYFRAGTASLSLNPILSTNYFVSTNVAYGGALFSSGYQLLIGMKKFDQQIDSTIPLLSFNISTKNLTQTYFIATFLSPLLSKTNIVQISYMTIDNYIKNNFQVYVINNKLNFSTPLLVNPTTTSMFQYNYTNQIRYRTLIDGIKQIKLAPFIKGLIIQNQVQRTFSLKIQTSILNDSFYEAKLISYSNTQYQNLSQIQFSVFAFNITRLQAFQTLYQNSTFVFDQSSLIYNHPLYYINQTNFFIGLQGLSFYNSPNVKYELYADYPSNSVHLLLPIPELNGIFVLMINIQHRVCVNSSFSFYMDWSHICYSNCPSVIYYQNATSAKCIRCPSDCYQCLDNKECTVCNATYHHREEYTDLLGYKRCKALIGYYNDRWNNPIAPICNSNCKECFLNSTNCTKCVDGKYLNFSTVDNTSSCQPCRAFCATCKDSLTCQTCQDLYVIDSTFICVTNCSRFCQTCHKILVPLSYVCDTCYNGYYKNLTYTSDCYSTCGDGFWGYLDQQCDDGNVNNTDGCDSQCRLQPGYQCINNDTYPPSTTSPLPQTCYYVGQIKLVLKKLIKTQNKNIFEITLLAETINRLILKQFYWDRILSLNVQFPKYVLKSVVQNYLDASQMLIDYVELRFQVSYQRSLPNVLEFTINPAINKLGPLPTSSTNNFSTQNQPGPVSIAIPTSSIKFDIYPATKKYFPLKSSNGMGIMYHQDSFFTTAIILQYIFQICAALGLILFLCSMSHYGGKVIALECIFVLNVTYFSLIGFSNLQIFPTIKSISGLKWVVLDIFAVADYDAYQGKNIFWWMGISNSYLVNCIILIFLLAIPFILYVIILVANRWIVKKTQTMKTLNFLQTYCLTQLLMSVYFICAYSFIINFFLSIYSLVKGKSTDIVGISVGMILFLLGIFQLIVFNIKKMIFWQFSNSFYKQKISQYYMAFHLLIIWVNSIFIVALCEIIYGNLVTIVLSILHVVLIVKIKPFRQQTQYKRSIIIQIINILIQCIQLILKIQLSQRQQSGTLNQISTVFLYFPIVILSVLFFTLIYTAYHLIVKIKLAYQHRKEYLQNQNIIKQKQRLQKVKLLKMQLTERGLSKGQQSDYEKKIVDELNKVNSNVAQATQFGDFYLNNILEMDKNQLNEKWGDLANINNIDPCKDQVKKMKKQVLKKGGDFMTFDKMSEYFRIKYNQNDNDDIVQNNKDQTQKQQIQLSKNQNAKKSKHTKKKKEKQITPQKPSQQCINCQEPITVIKDQNPLELPPQEEITHQYQEQKYKQQWKNFFKKKQLTELQKSSSLGIYEAI